MNRNGNDKLWQKLLWIILCLVACALQVHGFSSLFRPMDIYGLDFFQDWASARNFSEGLPIYTHHDITVNRYREAIRAKPGYSLNTTEYEYNAHPPSSALLVLPLARLDLPAAFLIWTMISLLALVVSFVIILRQCPVAFNLWAILPLAVLLMWCISFRGTIHNGQFYFFLLLLFTGTWVADRSQRPWLAGALLGTATAIKLAPGFVFLYFLIRKQWRALAGGAIAFLALTALTVLLLGPECYLDYKNLVLPALQKPCWRVHRLNYSLPAFWNKLFNSQDSDYIIPLWQNPTLTSALVILSDTIITALAAWSIWRSRSLRERDIAFSLTMFGMMLLSPITWELTLAMAYLSLFLLWYWIPSDRRTRIIFWVILIPLWIPQYWPQLAFRIMHSQRPMTASSLHVLTVQSVFTYALVAMFIFAILMIRRMQREDEKSLLPNKPANEAALVV